MEKKVIINERYVDRIDKASRTLIEGYDNIDFSDPNWEKKVDSLSKLHAGIASDIKNVNDAWLEEERLRIEEEKNKTDSENKLTEMDLEEDRLRLDEARDKDAASNNKIRNILDAAKITAMLVSAGITGYVGIWKFKQSTQKEEDGALLTTTDQTTVREGLRDKSPGIQWFKF